LHSPHAVLNWLACELFTLHSVHSMAPAAAATWFFLHAAQAVVLSVLCLEKVPGWQGVQLAAPKGVALVAWWPCLHTAAADNRHAVVKITCS
jgi:hypothetical protein